MLGNDIDNAVVPRLFLVFEDLLGIIDSKNEQKATRLIGRKKFKDAVDLYQINEPLAHRIWDVTFRFNFGFDVVTWRGVGFAKAVREWVDDNDLPIQHVTAQDKASFARKMVFMPYLARIYVPSRQDLLTFGSKATLLSPHDPASLNQIGRF